MPTATWRKLKRNWNSSATIRWSSPNSARISVRTRNGLWRWRAGTSVAARSHQPPGGHLNKLLSGLKNLAYRSAALVTLLMSRALLSISSSLRGKIRRNSNG